jgi:2-amino-4-hydroxy-6-hydroxymethyldihydropteridine diphosphokinase
VVRAAAGVIAAGGLKEVRLSPLLQTAPLGPSKRRFANAAIAGRWDGDAHALFHLLKRVERDFGRGRGQRWGARVLDCDLLAFGDAVIHTPGLQVPHPRLQQRDFVLRPMLALAPDWRHPRLRLTVRQMLARLQKPRPVDSGGGAP